MNKMSNLEKALELYYDVGISPYPNSDISRIHNYFTKEEAVELEKKILEIEQLFDTIKVDWGKHDLVSGAIYVISEVAKVYPELSIHSLKILKNAYCFYFK